MSRPIRLEFAGAQANVALSDEDGTTWLQILGEVFERFKGSAALGA